MELGESGTLEVSRPDLEIHLRKDAEIGIRADFANCKAGDSSNITGGNEDELMPHLTLLLSTGGEIEVGPASQDSIARLQSMMEAWALGERETRPLSIWAIILLPYTEWDAERILRAY